MPAREEVSLNPSIQKLGIFAGEGVLPQQLLQSCQNNNIECLVIGFSKHTHHVDPDFWGRIGSSGKTLDYLKSEKIKDIVMIGAIKRPGIFSLWPDWVTFKFFLKVWLHSFGDSSLLSALRQALEERGFKLHGVHEFLPELLMPEGIVGKHDLRDQHRMDIQVGLKAARELGEKDIGQAVIVKEGQVIGEEDKKGTSALIKKYGVEGAILVKTCKPQQDKNLDLPTIGPETARLCAEKKMAGLVGQAGQSLLVERDETVKIADQYGLFVLGVSIE